MGLFDAIGNGLTGLFGEGFADRAARAGAFLDGDYGTASKISSGMAEQRAAREQASRFVEALRAKGMPDEDIRIIMANPEKFSESFSSRFQTRGVDEGSSVMTPNLNGSRELFTAPKTFKEGADVMQTPAGNRLLPPASVMGQQDGDHLPGQSLPNANPNFNVSKPGASGPTKFEGLRTEAEQYADSIAERGSKEWGAAVKDHVMKAYGPSAQSMLGQRLDTQEEIAQLRDGTTRRGQDIRDATQRRGQTLGDARGRRGQDMTDRRVRDSAGYQGRGGKGGGKPAVVQVKSLEEARRLPPGTIFRTPDGRTKVR